MAKLTDDHHERITELYADIDTLYQLESTTRSSEVKQAFLTLIELCYKAIDTIIDGKDFS